MRGVWVLIGLGVICGVLSCSGGEGEGYVLLRQEAVGARIEKDSVHSSWYVFRREGLDTLRGWRWVLVLHRPTRHLIDSLLDLGIKVEAVYAPEHGLWGEVAAGSTVRDTVYRGVPVYSLYGKRRAPAADELRKVDAVLFALRDVGVRYYTYLSTLSLVLKAAAQAQKPVWVLDFPNPHAHYAYGALMDSSYFSFVGLHATPLVLGLTIGEYARLLVGEGWVPAGAVQVVPWRGWRRGAVDTTEWAVEARFFWGEAPSPALRSGEAIHLYPILGWYDGSKAVSVGRGLDSAFTLVGWDPAREAPDLPFRDTVLYEYRLRATRFVPQVGARKGEICAGWRITPPSEIKPDSLFRLGFVLLKAAYAAEEDSEAVFGDLELFDKLAGTPLVRWYVERGLAVEEMYRDFRAPETWERLRAHYQLYP